MQTDWRDFGDILGSPELEEPQGGYATGFGDCWEGQAIVSSWGFDTSNSDPYVAEQNDGDYACTILIDWSGADPGLAGC